MYPTMYPKIYPVKNKPYGLFFTGYIFRYIVGYIFAGYIFCALTLTVYNNLHQCSRFDNCVITNIEVANIVCDVEN